MAIANITINGRKISTQAGTTILKAAIEAGIYIPTLCDHPALPALGACRMCLVEVKGQRNLQTSCTFPVTEGMDIQTESEPVIKARKLILDLLFSERNHFCPYCEMSGSCELQDLGYKYGVDHWAFPTYTRVFPLDATHKYYAMDHNRCILCERCYRACNDLVANHTLGLRQRGSKTRIHADGNTPLGESSCISCGTCVQVCPTGALFYKRSAYMGRDSLTQKVKSTCGRCSIGCGIEVVTRGGNVLHINGDWEAPANSGLLCKMGRFDPLYEKRERITKPLIRKNKKYEEISWAEAFKILSQQIKSTKPQGAGVLVGSYSTNEALYMTDKLFRHSLKISNVGMLNNSAPKIFSGPQAVFEDIADSDIIIVTGTDPVNDQPVASYYIKRAVDRGARLIVVDSKENGLSQFASLNLKAKDIMQAVEIAERAANPIIIYGAGIDKKTAEELKKLERKARHIIIQPGVNTRAEEAFEIGNNFNPSKIKFLYVLLGEENIKNNKLLKDVPRNAFVAVQAGYFSKVTDRADLILPSAIWSEQSGSLTNTEGRVQKVNRAVEPAGEAKNDWEILQILAKRLGKDIPVSVSKVGSQLKKLLK